MRTFAKVGHGSKVPNLIELALDIVKSLAIGLGDSFRKTQD